LVVAEGDDVGGDGTHRSEEVVLVAEAGVSDASVGSDSSEPTTLAVYRCVALDPKDIGIAGDNGSDLPELCRLGKECAVTCVQEIESAKD
jgi:hypothetical protein